MDEYIYDYAVISRTDKEMELLAVAAARDFVDKYVEMCRRAGLKLVLIARILSRSGTFCAAMSRSMD